MHDQSAVPGDPEPVAQNLPEEQLVLEPLPTTADLDALQIDLDEIDRVLADLDSGRPDRREAAVTPSPSQSETPAPVQ